MTDSLKHRSAGRAAAAPRTLVFCQCSALIADVSNTILSSGYNIIMHVKLSHYHISDDIKALYKEYSDEEEADCIFPIVHPATEAELSCIAAE